MRVGPENKAGPSVQIPAERDLLGGRLRVHVDQPQGRPGALAEHVVRGFEGGVERWHEQLTLDVADQHLALLPQVMAVPAAPGRS